MISNVIVNALDADVDLELTKGSDLFAEEGKGDKYVVIKTTTTTNPVETIDVLRSSPVQILVCGHNYNEGFSIAEKVIAVILGLGGDYTYNGTESYAVRQVTVRNYPTSFKDMGDRVCFTANVTIFYEFSIQ